MAHNGLAIEIWWWMQSGANQSLPANWEKQGTRLSICPRSGMRSHVVSFAKLALSLVDQKAEVVGVAARKNVRVRNNNDALGRIMPEKPCRQSDLTDIFSTQDEVVTDTLYMETVMASGEMSCPDIPRWQGSAFEFRRTAWLRPNSISWIH